MILVLEGVWRNTASESAFVSRQNQSRSHALLLQLAFSFSCAAHNLRVYSRVCLNHQAPHPPLQPAPSIAEHEHDLLDEGIDVHTEAECAITSHHRLLLLCKLTLHNQHQTLATKHRTHDMTSTQVASGLLTTRWPSQGRTQRSRRHSVCSMAGDGGEGRGGAVNKAVAAGLLGLQLLSLPFAVVSRHPRGVGLPRLELVSAAAQAKAPKTLTLEEEMIREFLFVAVHGYSAESVTTCIMMRTQCLLSVE